MIRNLIMEFMTLVRLLLKIIVLFRCFLLSQQDLAQEMHTKY